MSRKKTGIFGENNGNDLDRFGKKLDTVLKTTAAAHLAAAPGGDFSRAREVIRRGGDPLPLARETGFANLLWKEGDEGEPLDGLRRDLALGAPLLEAARPGILEDLASHAPPPAYLPPRPGRA